MTSTQGLTSTQLDTLRDYLKVANDQQLDLVIRAVKDERNARYDRAIAVNEQP